MFTRFMALIAILTALGLSSGVATAADEARYPHPPSKPKTMWEMCAAVGEPERDRCMLSVPAKDSASTWQCNEVMQRARRRCMLDVLEGKHSVAEAN